MTTSPDDVLTCFEAHRSHFRTVAYRLTGSLTDADDAVQSAWIKAASVDTTAVENLAGWLTTVVSRECLDTLRRRQRRQEVSIDSIGAAQAFAVSAEDETVWVESVGRALLVVLERLSPTQRVAYVLHDMFSVPFDEVGEIVQRSPAATKKMASRARHRVASPHPMASDVTAETEVVQAYLNASRNGDIAALLEILAPEVVRTVDPALIPGTAAHVARGRDNVAEQTRLFNDRAQVAAVVLIDGHPGLVIAPGGTLHSAMLFSQAGSRITSIAVISAATMASRDINII